MKKLKILVLSDYAFVKGGAERVAISSVAGLAKKGNEVVFFSAVGPIERDLSEAGLYQIICLGQQDILDNPNKLASMISGIYNRRAITELKKLFSVWLPDIVHIHGVSKALSWAPVNLIYSYKIPIIYSLHDYGLICPNMGIFNFKTNEVCEYYKPGCGFKCFVENCDKRNYAQKLWRWLRFRIVRDIFKINRKISGFVAVSDFIGDLAKKYLHAIKNVRVIYNPVETDGKDIDKYKDVLRIKNQFLYVGRLSEEKGIDLLLSVMDRVDGNLKIIGDGELMEMCRNYQKKLGSEKIIITGYRKRSEVFSEMQKSIALVLPSRCMEPAPLVLGEAAYNGLPAVVANHGGLAEFIKDGINGLYFEPGNADSLIESMKKILKNNSLALEMGENARKIFKEKNLTINKHIDLIEDYYLEILDE